MRIDEISIEAFGQFEGLRLDDLSHPVIVFRGQNESGKSTLFEFLKTMFYGIYPVNSDNHPYAPWSGKKIEGSLRFTTSARESFTILRKMGSAPDGKLLNGEVRGIRNQTIPQAAHISRELFDAVYALSLSDMAVLEDRPWNEVQERLLGTVGLEIFKPTRAVVDQLQDEAASLWRSTRRGKPLSRELEQRIRELRVEAREAATEDSRIREIDADIHRDGLEMERLQAEQQLLRKRLRHVREVLPVHELKRRLELWRERAGAASLVAGLPADPVEALAKLKTELRALEEERDQAAQKLQELQEDVSACSESDYRLLALKGEIPDWSRVVARVEDQKETLEKERCELDLRHQAWRRDCMDVLDGDIDPAVMDSLRNLSISQTRAAVERFKETEAQEKEAAQAVPMGRADTVLRFLIPSSVLALVGISLLVGSVKVPSLLLPGIALLIGGAASSGLLFKTWQSGRKKEETRLRELGDEREKTLQAIREALQHLPIPQERKGRPDAFLINDLTQLQERLRTLDQMKSRLELLEQNVQVEERRYRKWLQEHQEVLLGLPIAAAHCSLEAMLREANERMIRSREATAASEELTRVLDRRKPQADRISRELNALEERLSALGSGDVVQGIEALRIIREAQREVSQLQERLETEHPEWESLLQEYEGLRTTGELAEIDTIEESELENRLEEVEGQLNGLATQKARQETELAHLQRRRSVSDIESEIEYLQQELRHVYFSHDRLALLAQVVRKAEERFRERHQPDVLKRAGRYLQTISGGRYSALLFDGEEQKFSVLLTGGSFPIVVGSPLSRGTLDQIYLSLRLALVEHLDENAESLPLFLDEVFVNWDERRREMGYAVLQELSQKRQLLVFTCHSWLRDEVETHLNAACFQLS